MYWNSLNEDFRNSKIDDVLPMKILFRTEPSCSCIPTCMRSTYPIYSDHNFYEMLAINERFVFSTVWATARRRKAAAFCTSATSRRMPSSWRPRSSWTRDVTKRRARSGTVRLLSEQTRTKVANVTTTNTVVQAPRNDSPWVTGAWESTICDNYLLQWHNASKPAQSLSIRLPILHFDFH